MHPAPNKPRITPAFPRCRPVTLVLAAAAATGLTPRAEAADLLFNGATLNSDLIVPPDAWIHVTNGLTLNNTSVTFAEAGAGMSFHEGTQTLGGTGQVIINARPRSSNSTTRIAGLDLTISPGITLRTGMRSGDSNGALQIGEAFNSVVNHGTIAAETFGMPLYLRGLWSNQGTIRVGDGVTAFLGGTFAPADIGTFVRTGGTVVIDGTLIGTGQTLTLDASTGSWLARGAHINGISIRTRDDTQFRVNPHSFPTFTGVTVAGTVIAEPFARLAIESGLNFSDGGSITLQSATTGSTSSTEFMLYGQETIGGTGEIVFDGPGDNTLFTVFNSSRITFGPNVTIRTGTGGGKIRSGTVPDAITIQGQVIAAAGGGQLTLSGVTLQGTISAPPGGRLALDRVQNYGQISTSQATLTLLGPLAGSGQYSIDASTIELAATLTSAQVRALPHTNSTLAVVTGGVVQNAQDTVALTSVAGGKVVGGTVTSLLPAIAVNVTGGTLDAVTLGSDLTVAPGASLTITNGLTIPAGLTLSMQSPSPSTPPVTSPRISLTGTQGLSGSGTISYDGDSNSSILRSVSSTLIIGSGLTIRTGTRGGTLGVSDRDTINNGTISAQTPGTKLAVFGSPLTNNGTMTAANGGILTLAPRTDFINNGTLIANAGSVLHVTGPIPVGGGVIDINGGYLALNYSGFPPANEIRQRLLTGRNGGDWTGPGIRSSAAANDPTGRTAVAYADGSSLLGLTGLMQATWHSVTVDWTSLVFLNTFVGDANLDGQLNQDDYVLIDKGVLTGGTYWWQGDFDYDGTVGPADYLLIDTTYLYLNPAIAPSLLQHRESQFGPAYVAQLLTSIPEPSLPAACVLAIPSLFRYPRKTIVTERAPSATK